MTQTYFVQTETLRIYFKKPKINFPNLIKFPNGFAQNTKYTIFHKPQIKDKLPLKLSILSINNYEIERSSSIKFIGKMVDKHLNQKGFINTLGNKNSQYERNDIHLLLVSSQLSDLRKYCLVQHNCLKIEKTFQQITTSDKNHFCYNR